MYIQKHPFYLVLAIRKRVFSMENKKMDKQKNKILTLRVSQDTRDRAHKAAATLHEQTLSEFLTKKIDRLLFEYDRELPKIQKAARQKEKNKQKEVAAKEVPTPRADRDTFKAELLYFVDSGININ